jgi:hypothetical protein
MEYKEIIKDEDLRTESYYQPGKTPLLRFIHIPSGLSVEYVDSNLTPYQIKLKAKEELTKLLTEKDNKSD